MAETSKDWENISTFYQTYMRIEKHLSANTVESYMRDLDIFKHYILRQYDVRPKEVCREMIEHFISWLYERQVYEKSTQARILSRSLWYITASNLLLFLQRKKRRLCCSLTADRLVKRLLVW